ncbi:MAG: NAD(P)-binding domain-containing protein [Chloroflexi bacterium]|nr:NAD(P)-binding domain-containing protein [Chloroflexota bacterium]
MANIAIIGSGRISNGLAPGWLAAGHNVTIGSRDPSGVEAPDGATITSQSESLRNADVVAIAIPYGNVEGFARDNADALRGKVVIDASNPMRGLVNVGISGAQVTANAIGEGARVVAAFKATFFNTLTEPVGPSGQRRDVWFAGEDEAAREITAGLIADLGFRPIDCGGMENTICLDLLVPLVIELNGRAGGERVISFSVLDHPDTTG